MTSIPVPNPVGYKPLNNAVNYLIDESKKDPKASNGTMILDFNKDGRFDRADLDAKIKELDKQPVYALGSSLTIAERINGKREKIQNEITLAKSVLMGKDLFMENGTSNKKTAISLFDFNKDNNLNSGDLLFKQKEAKLTGNKKSVYEAKMLEAMGLNPSTPKPPVPPVPPVDPNTKEWRPTAAQGKIDRTHVEGFDVKNRYMNAQKSFNDLLGLLNSPNPPKGEDLQNLRAKIEVAAFEFNRASQDLNAFKEKNPDLKKPATPELEKLMSAYSSAFFTTLPDDIKRAASNMIGEFWDGVYPPKNDINAMLKKLTTNTKPPIVDPPMVQNSNLTVK
ncbi:MAG: hypothetical protein LW809_00340 [Vampirovibrionales bacterium]|jgi:hypothetical protein|nr:hypothetical protein [Vampirovibrionales bacterium]